jgi:hypothetical protein
MKNDEYLCLGCLSIFAAGIVTELDKPYFGNALLAIAAILLYTHHKHNDN